MEFKYQEEYKTLSELCPPNDHKEGEISPVFRWVFDDIADERNFKSQYHKKPKRFDNKNDLDKCNALGLSMFNNFDGSVARFKELKEIIGESVFQTLGTKIAQGKISISDGVNGKIERHGHFNNHPSKEANYKDVFKIKDTVL